MRRWLAPLALALLLVAVIGCAGAAPTADTTGHGARPDPAAEVRFTALGWQDGSMPLDWLAVRFDTGEGAQTLSGSQLVVDEDYAQPHSQWFPTDTSGTLTVDFTLTSPSPESLSAGRVQLQLKDDWRWEIQFHLTEHDPLVGCFGCAGAERFLVSTESLASLWVVWGGNSISDPVVY